MLRICQGCPAKRGGKYLSQHMEAGVDGNVSNTNTDQIKRKQVTKLNTMRAVGFMNTFLVVFMDQSEAYHSKSLKLNHLESLSFCLDFGIFSARMLFNRE